MNRPACLTALVWVLLGCDSKPSPGPSPDFADSFARARELVVAERWAEAEAAYRNLEASAMADVAAQAQNLAELCSGVRAVLRAVAAGDPSGAREALGPLPSRADTLRETGDRLHWKIFLSRLDSEVTTLLEEDASLRKLVEAWPSGEDWPSASVADPLRTLLVRPESGIAKRTTEWLSPRADEQFGRAERLFQEGKTRLAHDGFSALERALPIEPWLSRARKGLEQTTKVFPENRGDRTTGGPTGPDRTEPKKTGATNGLFAIPLDFVPSDFVALRDGGRIVALHAAAGEAVSISLQARAVERTIRIGGRPRVLAEIGPRLWIGGDDGPIRLVETRTWSECGSVGVSSSGISSIVSSADGRVFAATSRHVVEIDPNTLKVLRTFEELRDARRTPARLSVRPDGALLYSSEENEVSVWRTDGTPGKRTGRHPGVVSDAQGQLVLGQIAVYDPYLNSLTALSGHDSDILVHPHLPFAVYFSRRGQTMKALDLYQLQFGPAVECGGSVRGLERRARLSADAKLVFVSEVQPLRSEDTGTTAVTAFPIPASVGETLPGHFAFVSLPPEEAHPGWEVRYVPRLSEPWAPRATVRMTAAPEGAVWSKEKGELRWTPAPGDVGKREIRLRAEDPGTGKTVDQRLFVDVRFRRVIEGCLSPVAKLSTDGRYLMGVERNASRILVYDFEKDREFSFPIPFEGFEVTEAGGRVYALDPKLGRIGSWTIEGKDERLLELEKKPFRLVARGTTLVAVVEGQELLLVDPAPKSLGRIGEGYPIAIAPNGETMVAAGTRGLGVYRFQDGRFQAVADTEQRLFDVQFSADGRHFRNGSQLYETNPMKLVKELHGHMLRLDPTGPYVAACGVSRTLEILRVDTWKVAHRMDLPRTENVTFALPLSKWNRVATGGDRGFLLVPCAFER